jgi:hypothetical protein
MFDHVHSLEEVVIQDVVSGDTVCAKDVFYKVLAVEPRGKEVVLSVCSPDGLLEKRTYALGDMVNIVSE